MAATQRKTTRMSLISATPETDRIRSVIEPPIEAIGYELVRVSLVGGGRRTLQIMIDCADGRTPNIDDCGRVSRKVSVLLDVDNPVRGDYVLEVSTPGIDRPLTRPKDFARFSGYEARVELGNAPEDELGGRRRFRGRLAGLEDDRVLIAEPQGLTRLPLGRITKAKLVLTDALLASSAQG